MYQPGETLYRRSKRSIMATSGPTDYFDVSLQIMRQGP